MMVDALRNEAPAGAGNFGPARSATKFAAVAATTKARSGLRSGEPSTAPTTTHSDEAKSRAATTARNPSGGHSSPRCGDCTASAPLMPTASAATRMISRRSHTGLCSISPVVVPAGSVVSHWLLPHASATTPMLPTRPVGRGALGHGSQEPVPWQASCPCRSGVHPPGLLALRRDPPRRAPGVPASHAVPATTSGPQRGRTAKRAASRTRRSGCRPLKARRQRTRVIPQKSTAVGHETGVIGYPTTPYRVLNRPLAEPLRGFCKQGVRGCYESD
jgi:hypothetical protein